MALPPGSTKPGECVKLRRSIYGLKQSPRQWYGRLTAFLKPLGYEPTNFDPCVLVHTSHEIIIAIYVDDITIFGRATTLRYDFKESLKREFAFSDLGSLSWLLGIQIQWQSSLLSVTLLQRAYIDQLLVKFGMSSCNPVKIPLDPNQRLDHQEGYLDLADTSTYRQIIGSLMYLVIGTRPDLSFTVSALSQFSSKPTKAHMGALKQVLRYLKGMRDLKLTYTCNPDIALAGYSDADFAGDRVTRKSTTGYIFQLARNTICWRAVKQRGVSTSTVEAEYIALSTTAKQHMWLQNALNELQISIPSALSTDNDGTIDLTENPRISDRSKHIDVAYHHVRDLVETRKLTVLHIPSADNLADLCTKPFPYPRLRLLRDLVLGTDTVCAEGGY